MNSLLKTGIFGALGGLTGALAMHQFRLVWDARATASPASGIFGFDEESDINAVDQIRKSLSLPPLPRSEALQLALMLHYAFGALSGAAYALLTEAFPNLKAGRGLLFGSLLWLAGDELAVSMTGISDPTSKTASSHLSALAAHLLFGTVTESGRQLLSRLTQSAI